MLRNTALIHWQDGSFRNSVLFSYFAALMPFAVITSLNNVVLELVGKPGAQEHRSTERLTVSAQDIMDRLVLDYQQQLFAAQINEYKLCLCFTCLIWQLHKIMLPTPSKC